MATEALRRLREEIDAAFEAQRGTSHENKQVQISSESLAPKWAQVTALLASVGRPATKRNSPGTEKLISQSFLPVRCSTRDGNNQKMTDSERRSWKVSIATGAARVAEVEASVLDPLEIVEGINPVAAL
ncbi:hypothetical protein KRP22_014475 [Phytophthora ramorum]|nr:hypothetical protein KRP22_8921 [Phytophthora ramorum]